MGHENELTIEEPHEILNEVHQETQRNGSPSEQEEDERGPMPTSAIKDLLKKWADVRARVLEWHPNQADVSRFHSDASVEAVDRQAPNNITGSDRRKVTSARDDRHLFRIAVNDFTAFSRQLEASWSIATGVPMSASSIRRRLLHRGLRARCLYTESPSRQTIDGYVCNGFMSTEPGKLIGTNEVLSDKSRFNRRDHDGHIRVRIYASYANLLLIEGNLNSYRYVREVLQPGVVPFLLRHPWSYLSVG
ncbi:transposable element Tcb2 transposase [Trichonephila clavipes]|uniref:Transposable element Tcb2 transposase n=1 Tax=Trichonephila clavipes TaxID=2585209 RepID=A0A8X6W600_TRICX|nr:transposable element Tcb2 transposase [Trichonephila clavipes]